MPKPFLDEITEHVLKHYGEATGEICLVTPNKRAGLFIRKYFSQKLDKPVWAPETLSIEMFINRISGMKITDNINLLFTLYEVYRLTENDQAQNIDEFSNWAPVLLNDFDEIDANIEDPQAIFNYLQDIKRIETWNPDGSPLTDFQRKYLSFFSKLKIWHHELSELLIKNKQSYQGLSSRQAASRLKEDDFVLPWKKVLFIGFNALNYSEQQIIQTLLNRGQAEFIPDSDPYYTEDPDHEAGQFIRRFSKEFGHSTNQNPFIAGQRKNISILGIAKNVNQARLAGNIFQQRKDVQPNIDTAIVLANEKLLIPTLNALPEEAENINVTMGYPLIKTTIYGFFDALWKVHLSRSFGEKDTANKHPSYYQKDLLRFFTHPITSFFWNNEEEHENIDELIRALKHSNQSFFTYTELDKLASKACGFSTYFQFLNGSWEAGGHTIFDTLLTLISRLDKAFRDKANTQGKDIINTSYFIDFEALYSFSSLFRRLNTYITDYPFIDSAKSMYKLFKQLSLETRLSFSGEPLQGMQVMGMLETRNLDFKNVIILSANENIMPRPKNNQSFIPFDVKKKFGLHVHNDKDAIYAYHCYRLLQRAENIFVIYNTQTEDIGSSEKSRFVTQWLMELPDKAPNINISEQIIALPPPSTKVRHDNSIPKSQDIIDRLLEIGANGFSPSALNTFITCQLQFYFAKIARLEEADNFEETIEATTMGTVVHGVLEELYRPHISQIIQLKELTAMIAQTDKTTRRLFEKHYPGGNISSGKNLLLFNLAKRYIQNFLTAELEFLKKNNGLQIKILSLEEKLSGTLEVSIDGKPVAIKIKGTADRIDQVGHNIRLIDYKTGRFDPRELKLKDWESVVTDDQYGKAFQLLTYAWLYKQQHPETEHIQAGIISLKETRKGFQTLMTPEGSNMLQYDQIQMFSHRLGSLIGSIFDNTSPFKQTSVESNCKYCPFKVYCRRF